MLYVIAQMMPEQIVKVVTDTWAHTHNKPLQEVYSLIIIFILFINKQITNLFYEFLE